MKHRILRLTALLLAVLSLCSCTLTQTLRYVFTGEDATLSPLEGKRLEEPDYINYEVSRVWYETLNSTQQQAYRLIYNALPGHPAQIRIPELTRQSLSEVVYALRWDNPQILCFSLEYTFVSAGGAFYIRPEYTESAATCRRHTLKMLENAQSLLQTVTATTGWAGELALHDAVCECCEYGSGARDDSAYGVLVNGRAVCGGYAAAAKLLFDMAGLHSTLVSGRARDKRGSEAHIWNAVSLGGDWYFTDVTWDDPVVENGSPVVSHAYFNVSASDVSATHFDYDLPRGLRVDGGKYDYFRMNNCYCQADDWESVVLQRLRGLVAEGGAAEFRFSTVRLLEDAVESLFSKGGMENMLHTLSSSEYVCAYAVNEDASVLRISLR